MTRRIVWTVVIVVALAAVAVPATFSAFSATTTNSGNTITAGSVSIGDNDGASQLFNVSNQKPGDTTTKCIQVTYAGSLASAVRLYGSASGGLAPYLTLKITRGTETTPGSSCGTFSADSTDYAGDGAGVVWTGKLSAYPTSFATGQSDPLAAAPETWTTNEAHSFKLAVTVDDDNNAQGQTANASFTWEARNQ